MYIFNSQQDNSQDLNLKKKDFELVIKKTNHQQVDIAQTPQPRSIQQLILHVDRGLEDSTREILLHFDWNLRLLQLTSDKP